ncbi:hypothetical protein Phum_PHUM025590 [Pediculus humanus corporis]|uniref:Telomeric repeat-binding factor 2-interacting protein 1 n=1 Tax=Pediculus humanus subsp. corporis TaxID=121224 RepID=E0VA18_PEDHC|nr:uncharacterized protein Phum_PHUM025590 [Pediculus humanus corporis]EEB10224.1 hypothetical protein Phum_PHUM025590 [Pediculus humanus corporis]
MNSNQNIKSKREEEKEISKGYTLEEDVAIVNYITDKKRYLHASGIQVWKNAEKIKICPGRSYLSMKERYRKTILKNIKSYKIDKNLICKILEFQRATQAGKRIIRLKELQS